jgi:NTE family protein
VGVALALSGGAALGIAHVGVLDVLEKASVPIDAIAGTSAGSMVGALYAAGMTVDDLIQLSRHVNWTDFSKAVIPKRGLARLSKMEEFFEKHVGKVDFKDLRVPFVAVAANLVDGEELDVREGPVAPAVAASCTIPGIFEPIESAGKLLVDGGLTAFLPVGACRKISDSPVVGSDLSAYVKFGHVPVGVFATVLQSVFIMQLNQVQRSWADIIIKPDVSKFNQAVFARIDDLIEAGRVAARERLPEIEALLGG